ncbi:MAG: hypothetical protein ABSG95_05460 [Solirubrobacteraceae bacterium]
MPTASATPARSSRSARAGAKTRRGARLRGAAAIGAGERVQWGRFGRMAMLCVLVALVYLYASAGLRMLSTWRQARRDGSRVLSMEREHRLLVGQHEALGRRSTLEVQARRLGMMRSGEQPYLISGLPND